jgi:hypothetical protein
MLESYFYGVISTGAVGGLNTSIAYTAMLELAAGILHVPRRNPTGQSTGGRRSYPFVGLSLYTAGSGYLEETLEMRVLRSHSAAGVERELLSG